MRMWRIGLLLVVLGFLGGNAGVVWAGYTTNGNGTVTDTITGLIWQQADDGVPRIWEQALSYCEGLNLGGNDDWRLPNALELQSLVDYSRYNPSIDPVFECRSVVYWSGTTADTNPGVVWGAYFYNGFVYGHYKWSSLYTRCVRGGLSEPSGSLTISQNRLSGPPGTTFVQFGTGFTPNSTATLHVKKPDGTEYPTMKVDLDSIGHFEIPYTAPYNKPPGTYIWWAMDDATGGKSNEVSYVVEGATGELHHFEFSKIGDPQVQVKERFGVAITARNYQGNPVTGFNGEVLLSLVGPGRISTDKMRLDAGVGSIDDVSIDEPSRNTRIHAVWNEVTGESDPFAVLSSGSRTGSLMSWVAKPGKYGKTPLSGAKVMLAGNDLNNPIAIEQTDQNGIFKFENIESGHYFLWATNGEYRSTTQAVVVSAGKRCHPDVLIVHEGKRPVILVPGIMGTGEKGHMASRYPTLPATMPADQDDLELHDPGDHIPGYQGAVGWEALRDALADDYEVYDCPYDWRVSLTNAKDGYEKYLLAVIKEAKENTGWDKVDVVAHSMGGLLVRNYIQSGSDYKEDIEKFAMVGTPNHGSLNVYRMQEGGDPVAADEAVGKGCPGVAPYFYSTVSDNVYRAMRKTRMIDFDKLDHGNCVEKMLVTKTEARTFFTESVPTARQLMPVFPGSLKRDNTSRDIENSNNVNKYLKDLNADSWLSRMSHSGGSVITKIFASNDVRTMARLPVKESSDSNLYEDGEPTAYYCKVVEGDGTVPAEESAQLPGIDFLPDRKGEHVSLIKKFTREIVDFLNEGRSLTARTDTEFPPRVTATPAAAVLGVSLSGRAAPLLVDPDGARCGVRDGTQQSYEEASGCTVVRSANGGGVALVDPSDGVFSVEFSGDAVEDVSVTVSYQTETVSLERRFDLFYPGAPVAFDFLVDPAADPALQVISKPRQPEDLRALATAGTGGDVTTLTWSPVTDPNLEGYRIYSRRDDQPTLALLATTSAGVVNLTTDHSWNEPRRVYAVSAVTAAGKESFLSIYVENRSVTVADFSAATLVGETPLNVQFQDRSTGPASGWQWDFGDGATSGDRQPVHIYGAAGAYTVKLVVTGEEGEDVKIRESYINVYAPVTAAFEANPPSGAVPLTVQFSDASTGSVTGWYWDFGDGSSSGEQNPAHTYNTPGTYTVSLTASGPVGNDIESRVELIKVNSGADLSVSMTDAPDPVSVGVNLIYRLQVSNAGPGAASGVVLTDTLPAGVAFISAQASQGGCNEASGKVTCNLGGLAAGGSAGVQVTVRPSAAGVVTNTATVAATDADPNPANNTASVATTVSSLPTVTVVATDPQASEQVGNRGQFTVYRTGDTSKYLTVKYTVSGTGANGMDYARLSGSVTIPARAASAAVSVSPVNDALFEGDETVLLSLQPNAFYLVGPANSATVVIADNDLPAVTITATDGAAKEAGQDPGQLRIARTGSTGAPLVVYYTVSGTATGGSDYLPLSGSLNLAAGVSSGTVAISPLDDQEYEGSETVVVTLVANPAYTLGSSKSATVSLADDDLPVVTVAATDSQASEPGTDKGLFTFSRTGNISKSLMVKYTLSGTATNGSDYSGPSGTVAFAAGRSSAIVTVTPRDDRIKEGEETVQLTVAPGTLYRVGVPEGAVVSIADND